MSTFSRLEIATAVIAALAAGMVLLAGDANAKVRNGDRHDKDHDRVHLADRKHKKTNARDNLVCRGIAGCAMHTGSSNSGTPPATKPLPGAPARPGSKPVATTGATPVGSAKRVVGLSNGVATSRLANGPNGLTVSVNSPGAITVSNGTNSVTIPGGSLAPSGTDVSTSTTTEY